MSNFIMLNYKSISDQLYDLLQPTAEASMEQMYGFPQSMVQEFQINQTTKQNESNTSNSPELFQSMLSHMCID